MTGPAPFLLWSGRAAWCVSSQWPIGGTALWRDNREKHSKKGHLDELKLPVTNVSAFFYGKQPFAYEIAG